MRLKDQSVAAVLLLLCVQSLHGSALPAVSSYEFTAYRMQQYNLAQQKRGKCRVLHLTNLLYVRSLKSFLNTVLKKLLLLHFVRQLYTK